ncbi:MAG: CNNM domain-containing protein [Gilvibacter sp.]
MTLLIIYAVVSIAFSFLCSILEAVLLSITPSFINIKKAEGKKYIHTLESFKKDVDKPLIAILTLNTIAHTVGAIMVGVQAESLDYELNILGINMVGIVSGVMTLLILVLSEIIPKTIGATYWKALANFTAKTLTALIFPLKYTGLLWLLQLTTRLIGKSAHVSTLSREEFIAITHAAEKEGVFAENESTVIKNLLVFKSILAKDVMTPWVVAVTESEDITIAEFHENHKNLKFSRIPVYSESQNNPTGFILKDHVLEAIIDKKGHEKLSTIRRELLITDFRTPIPDLFELFISKRAHLCIAMDEFGNTVGLVSMEDIIETLLGLEIMDESDNVADMQLLARKNWEARAKRLGIEISDLQDFNDIE